MRQIAREKKKNKLFKTDPRRFETIFERAEPKGKRGDKLLFFKSLRFPLRFPFKKRAQVVDFFPAGVYNGNVRSSGLKNRKSRRGGRCRRKKTENGENALRTSGRTRKCAVAVRRPLRAGDERKATKRRLESRRIGGRTLRAPAFAFAGKRKKLKKPPLPGKKKMEKKR